MKKSVNANKGTL